MSKEREGGRLRAVVVVGVAAAACVQLFGVTFISIPPEAAPVGTRAAAQAVLHSYFEEEWKLFAPSPVISDRSLMVQAAWRDGDDVVTGEWIDLTEIDNRVVRHAVGAPRSAYLTSRIAGGVNAAWSQVGDSVRGVVRDASSAEEPLTDAEVLDLLTDEGIDRPVAEFVGDYDRAASTYTTDALRTLEPDRELVGVRYGSQMTTNPPWDERTTAEPKVGEIEPGPWRVPAEDEPARREAIAAYLERHR